MRLPVLRIFKKLSNFFSLLLLIPFFSSSLLAQSEQLFSAGNAAYQEGNYQQAVEQYEAILVNGQTSKAVYYNLGNAYYRLNEPGKAVLYYERALKLAPNDQDILFNLQIVRQDLADDLETIQPFFLKRWWRNWHRLFSATVWSVMAVLLWWAAIAAVILWLLGKEREQKKKGFVGGIVLAGLSLLLLLTAQSQANYEQHSQEAIVLQAEIDLKNAPDNKSSSLLTIHEGLKVQLLDEVGGWYKVQLSNSEQGWLPRSSLEEI